jgi:hypothetical protein
MILLQFSRHAAEHWAAFVRLLERLRRGTAG